MTKDPRKRVTVNLNDGTTKFIRFTTPVLVDLEKMIGDSPVWAITQERKVGHKLIGEFLWAGLRGENSPLALAAVYKLMHPGELEHYTEQIIEAMKAAGVLKEEKVEEDGDDVDPTQSETTNSTPIETSS